MPIRVVREQIVTIDPGVEASVPCPSSPIWCRCSTSGRKSGGDILFGNSDLSDVEEADPDNYLNRATDAFVDLTVDKVGTRFPGFDRCGDHRQLRRLLRRHAGLEPGDLRTDVDGLFVAAGFSGHGFKIAPAVGRLVADLVVDGHSNDPRIPHSDFRLSRFAEGDLLKSPYPYVGAGQMR